MLIETLTSPQFAAKYAESREVQTTHSHLVGPVTRNERERLAQDFQGLQPVQQLLSGNHVDQNRGPQLQADKKPVLSPTLIREFETLLRRRGGPSASRQGAAFSPAFICENETLFQRMGGPNASKQAASLSPTFIRKNKTILQRTGGPNCKQTSSRLSPGFVQEDERLLSKKRKRDPGSGVKRASAEDF